MTFDSYFEKDNLDIEFPRYNQDRFSKTRIKGNSNQTSAMDIYS